jgi:hypothetical protein
MVSKLFLAKLISVRIPESAHSTQCSGLEHHGDLNIKLDDFLVVLSAVHGVGDLR